MRWYQPHDAWSINLIKRGCKSDMKSRSFGWGTGLAVVFLLVISIGACSSNSKAKQGAQRAVPVAAGDVLQKDVPVQVKAIGNVEAYNTVSIKAQISGEVEGVYFQEGQDVKTERPPVQDRSATLRGRRLDRLRQRLRGTGHRPRMQKSKLRGMKFWSKKTMFPGINTISSAPTQTRWRL